MKSKSTGFSRNQSYHQYCFGPKRHEAIVSKRALLLEPSFSLSLPFSLCVSLSQWVVLLFYINCDCFCKQMNFLRLLPITRTFPRHSTGLSAREYLWGWGFNDSSMIHLSETQTRLADTRARHQHLSSLAQRQRNAKELNCLACRLCLNAGPHFNQQPKLELGTLPRSLLTPPQEWQELDITWTIHLELAQKDITPYSSEPSI